jgi:hypothetical protein
MNLYAYKYTFIILHFSHDVQGFPSTDHLKLKGHFSLDVLETQTILCYNMGLVGY